MPTARPSSSTAQILVPGVASPSGRTPATSRSTFASASSRDMPTYRSARPRTPPGAQRPSPRTRPPGAAGARSRRPAPRARPGRACGRSTITRCPQSATRRSLAPSRRVYSKASSSGSCASRAPQRMTTGQRDLGADPGAGRRRSSPAPAIFVSVCRALRAEQPVRRARRERGRVGDEPRPEDRAPVPVTVGVAVAEAARRRGRAGSSSRRARAPPRTASSSRCRPARRAAARGRARDGVRASRSATSPPNEWPATSARRRRPPPRARRPSRRRSRPSSRPARAAAEPAWPGRSTAITRWRRTSSGSTSTQFVGRAAEPVQEQERLALSADVVVDRARRSLVLEARCGRHARQSILG